ncbi:SRPBCC family protein [Streptomyces sp. SBT349]|uniref:SRPBCC family protein n=1 Tax=Streptomyces sp. SBT349 TaxID=1580539 RepID=UPI00066B08D3|nr:SRPBCC domain-containing protein [Streptomyces sp. SBT349]
MGETVATEEFTYELSREVDASAARAFEAWTDAAQYEEWTGAKPGSVELDARAGGAWKSTVIVPGGGEFPLTGSYVEVTAGRRLVVAMDRPGDLPPSLMTATFHELPGGTSRVTLFQGCDTAEERDMSQGGSTMLLDSLVAYLARS